MADTTLLLELKSELDELARDLWSTERVPPRLARKCESIMERLPAANAETAQSDHFRGATKMIPAAQVTDEQIESAAKVLWNRFSPNHFVEWKDEPNKAEYRDAARALSLAPDTAAIRNKALEDAIQAIRALAVGDEIFVCNAVDAIIDLQSSPQVQEAEKGSEK